MTATVKSPVQLKAWKALADHHQKIKKLHLRKLFADDPKRGERLTAAAAGLFLDYSKNRITDQNLKLLVQRAEESGLRARIGTNCRRDIWLKERIIRTKTAQFGALAPFFRLLFCP